MSIAPGTTDLDAVVANLASMLSACVSFQKLVQAADAAEALESIYAYRVAGTVSRPYAVILDEASARRRIAESCAPLSGRLVIQIEVDTARQAEVTSASDASNLVAGDLAGHANDRFNGQTLTMLTGIYIGESAEVQDFVGLTGAIVLADALPGTPSAGDGFRIAPADLQDEHRAFTKLVDAIVGDLWDLDAAGGGYLLLREISRDWGQPDESQEAGYFGANLRVDWGFA